MSDKQVPQLPDWLKDTVIYFRKPVGRRILTVAFWLLIFVVGFIAGGNWNKQPLPQPAPASVTEPAKAPIMTTDVIRARVERAKELTTEKYFYTNAGTFKANNKLWGIGVPFTDKSFIVKYNGTIHAGVNLDELTSVVIGDTIYLRLPDAQVLSHDVDHNSIETLDERGGFFNPIKINDISEFMATQEANIENLIYNRQILTYAKDTAKTVLRELLELDPSIQDHYKIEFVDELPEAPSEPSEISTPEPTSESSNN